LLAQEIWSNARNEGTDVENDEFFTLKIPKYDNPDKYDTDKGGVLFKTLAGLGSNEIIVTVDKDKKYFTVNIGNNWISNNRTGWVEGVKDMDIKVEEAEYSAELVKIARDCTCGITYFDGYPGLIKDDKDEDKRIE